MNAILKINVAVSTVALAASLALPLGAAHAEESSLDAQTQAQRMIVHAARSYTAPFAVTSASGLDVQAQAGLALIARPRMVSHTRLQSASALHTTAQDSARRLITGNSGG